MSGANVNETLAKLAQIDGFIGTSIVDSQSGMMLGVEGNNNFNLEVAAAGNTEVVRSKVKTMRSLGLDDSIEDILITLGKQYHLIRLVGTNQELFIYLVLYRERANLAMARRLLAEAEKSLQIS